jgi:hypothetical protein
MNEKLGDFGKVIVPIDLIECPTRDVLENDEACLLVVVLFFFGFKPELSVHHVWDASLAELLVR